MNFNKLFFAFSSIILLVAAFIYLSPALITNDFIYPLRVDSIYVRYHSVPNTAIDSNVLSPTDEGLIYKDITIKVNNGVELKGWYIPTIDTPANTVMIIHDLNQSKIMLLDHIRQLHDRGLHIFVVDLRAHGTSDGQVFTPGMPVIADMKISLDTLLKMQDTKHIVLFGMGIGAAIAMQTAVYDGRCDALILQSPFNNLQTYLDRYSYNKWGGMKYLWYPIFKKKVEKLLQYPIAELDLAKIASYSDLPVLFITGGDDEDVYTSETLQVYLASASPKKELFLVKNAGHYNIAAVGGEKYYNRISNFILNILPKQPKKTRFKKLV